MSWKKLLGSVKSSTVIITWIAAAFAVGFASGFFTAATRVEETSQAFQLPREAMDLLAQHYIDPLPDPMAMQRGMTRGLLDSLGDPYTTYLDPAAHELENQSLSGSYGGIGAHLTSTKNGWALIPFEQGPALEAGLLEGDLLLQVDNFEIEQTTTEAETTAALRGEIGTSVRLTVLRDNRDVIEFQIIRQSIPLPSVSSYLYPDDPHIGILRISVFGTPTAGEVRNNLKELERQDASAIILDLRGNPGGLLDSALQVADIFLSDGIIVTEISAEGKRTDRNALAHQEDFTLPVVVLIDGATASAAEVLAAALAENDRAIIIGHPTFGKGSVQTIYDLSDGSSLHITTSRWLTPKGHTLDGQALAPDQIVEPEVSGDAALEAAVGWISTNVEELP
ncbi:MAG: S41 family peptidase [Anaerolineales bacterium]